MLEVVTSNYARSIGYFQRAAARAEMGEQLDEALEDAERALRLSPRDMRQFPLAAKGWVHYKRKEFARAVECLSRAAELGETPTGLAHLGLAYLAVGDAKAARKAFDRAKRRGGRSTGAARRPGGQDARADPAEPPADREGLEPAGAPEEPDGLRLEAGLGAPADPSRSTDFACTDFP